jgi:hypothetical protein
MLHDRVLCNFYISPSIVRLVEVKIGLKYSSGRKVDQEMHTLCGLPPRRPRRWIRTSTWYLSFPLGVC